MKGEKVMYLIIDRFEGEYAVCERQDRTMVDIPKAEMPQGAKEGSKIEKTSSGYVIVDNSTGKERIDKKFKSLFK